MSKPTTSETGTGPSSPSEQDSDQGYLDGRSASQRRAATSEYEIRRYREDDRDQFLELYESVFGERRTTEWFEWRYGGPFGDGIEMFVAERDGELVAAEPFVSLPMRAGDETTLALQPADAMVHADHRGDGLLTRMTERALAYYDDRPPSVVFNFPNEAARSAYLKLGWVDVGTVSTAYRIQNPSAFLDASGGLSVDAVAGSAADAGASMFNRLTDAVPGSAADADGSVTVRRHAGVPAELLAELYESAPPRRLHVPRTEAFCEWRFSNPNWDVQTYTAHRDDNPVAALVAATDLEGDVTTTRLLDALPAGDRSGRTDALETLVSAAVDDYEVADVLAVSEDTLPSSVLSSFGFLRDDSPPASLFCSPTAVVARPLSRDPFADWTLEGRHLSERRDWRLPFAVQDCG